MKTIIAPSLLSADFCQLQNEFNELNKINNLWFHLDVMDGHFVPNLTFGATVLKNFQQYSHHPLDAHLMVTRPQDYIKSFSSLGLHNFTFHIESDVDNPLEFIKEIKQYYPSAGITLKPSTPNETLTDHILKEVDLVLVMSVEPGFGGQSFIEGSEKKINWLKNKREELGAHYLIQVDGGINQETSKKAIQAGADILVAGSYVFNQQEYAAAINDLRKG